MSHHVRRTLVATVSACCVAFGLMGAATAQTGTSGSGACAATLVSGPTRVGNIGGIARAQVVSGSCRSSATPAVSHYPGSPPLVFHGGPVMSTPANGNQVVVTPIFWEPSGFSFTAAYKNLITTYLNDLAADSDKTSNVFATTFQYFGSNGAINYRFTVGTPISDANAFPTPGCTTNAGSVYADSSGYTTCLDDAQVSAETSAVVGSHSLARDLGHLYVMLLPKHVESCFFPGNPAGQQCTINPTPSATYCAYHSLVNAGGPTVYAAMPFPVYSSATGFSCTTETLGGPTTIQQPNGNPDADVEISLLSHEMAEAITDPDVTTGWFDSAGFENGDDCAFIYGTLSGSDGGLFNQTINGHHYLTQEEFSNADFALHREACLQSMPTVVPSVTGVSPGSGRRVGGTSVTITGTGFPGATAVTFGGTSATFTITDATHITATAPAGSVGTVDVEVATPAGTSATTAADSYRYLAKPKVTSVSPRSGPKAGGTLVTVGGRGFVKGAVVRFGTTAGTSVKVLSARKLTVRSPHHLAGRVHVTVRTGGGRSALGTADRYTFR